MLLADDEPLIQRIGKRMLERMGFSVLVAGDGGEAVDLYREHTQKIVCVLLDLTMPRMDGGECFQELLRLNPDARVLMTSGFNEQEVTQKFAGQDLAGFVQKPFRMAQLQERIQQVLELQPTLREL